MRVFGRVSYKGTQYQGWQKQTSAPSVQETIEKELSQILNTPISIQGSGRTDAGVHAKGQTFHFDVDKEVDLERLRYSLNCLLPEDVYVKSLEKVDDNFHARYSAKTKVYQYNIHFGHRDVFGNDLEATIPQPCDLALFKEALKLFEGKHNFQNFTSKEEDQENFVREIYEINFEESKNRISITLKGNGFMRYMIRFLIGTALAISQGKENISFIKENLDDNNERNIVSYKAPSEGLYLVDVIY